MLKMTMLAAALTLAGIGAASAQNGHREWGGDQSGYGYGNGSSALGRYCPAGQYPHTWPNGGYRCQYADGDFSGYGSW